MKWLWDFLERIRACIAHEGDPAAMKTACEKVTNATTMDVAESRGELLAEVLPYLREYLRDCETCLSLGGDDDCGSLAGRAYRLRELISIIELKE